MCKEKNDIYIRFFHDRKRSIDEEKWNDKVNPFCDIFEKFIRE